MTSGGQDCDPVIIVPWCFTCENVTLYGKIDFAGEIKFVKIKVERFSYVIWVRIPWTFKSGGAFPPEVKRGKRYVTQG